MKRIQSTLARAAAALAWPGLVGLCLLLLALGLYATTLPAQRLQLQTLQRQLAKAREPVAANASDSAAPATATERLAAFHAFLPATSEVPELLKKVFPAAAQQGVRLDVGEYRLLREGSGALTQLQLTLPVHASYPQIRLFLASALQELATLALDSIEFDRQKVGEAAVDARIKLTLYLRKKP